MADGKSIKNIVVLGASGAIGSAIVKVASKLNPDAKIHAFSRTYLASNTNITYNLIDYYDEHSIKCSAELSSFEEPINMVIVATGILHNANIMPEKSLQNISINKFETLFKINTIAPAIIAKYFIPKLDKTSPSYFGILSARVGSISDNFLGGWYAYRASKAALNMMIKTVSIETVRKNKNAIVVGLHPGTVDSQLSKPFQASLPKEQLFSAEYAAHCLINVLTNLKATDSGKCFDYKAQEILP